MEGSIKFTEAKLEQAIIELLGEQGFTHVLVKRWCVKTTSRC